MRAVRTRLSYANVMSTIAVFLALGGGATAIALRGHNRVKADDVKITQRQGPLTSVPNDEVRVPKATCKPGEEAISGGIITPGLFLASATDWGVVFSARDPDNRRRWSVTFRNNRGTAVDVRALALCLQAP